MLPVLPSGETSSIGTWTGKAALRSSWIRRLNPRDDLERTKQSSDESDDRSSVIVKRAGRLDPPRIPDEASERLSACECREPIEEHLDGAERSDPVTSTKPDALAEELSESKRRSDSSFDSWTQTQEKKQGHDTDGESDRLAISRERVARQHQSGFGPWISLSAGSRLQEKPSSDAARAEPSFTQAFHASKLFVESQSRDQLGKRVQNGANEIFGFDNALPNFDLGGAQVTGKPPLPPIRTEAASGCGKIGWPPRSVIQYSHPSPSLSGRLDLVSRDKDVRISEREWLDSPWTVKAVGPSTRGDVVVGRELKETNQEKASRANLETGASSKDAQASKARPRDLEAHCFENGSYRSKVSGARVGDSEVALESHRNGGFGKKTIPAGKFFANQLLASQVEAKVEKPGGANLSHACMEATYFERKSIEGNNGDFPTRASSEWGHSLLGQRPMVPVEAPYEDKRPQTADLSEPAANGFLLRVPNSERGNSNLAKTAGVVSATAVCEVLGNNLQPLPKLTALALNTLETCHGATRSEKVDVTVLENPPSPPNPTSFPWEMFVEAAGASNKAREQFVEAYNKARDELKNQWSSHPPSSASHTGLVSGSSDLQAPGPRTKSSETHQRVWQFQGKFKVLNQGSESKFQHVGVNRGDQLASEREDKINALCGQKTKGFLTVHEDVDSAGCDAESCQNVKPRGVCLFGSPLNKGNCMLGGHLGQQMNGGVSGQPKDFVKQSLQPNRHQFRANSECSQEENVHENKTHGNNFRQSSNAILNLSSRMPRHKADKFSGVGDVQCNVAVENWTNLAATEKDHSFLKHSATVAGESDSVIDRQGEALPLLGKRQRMVLEDGTIAGTGACLAGKTLTDSTERPSSSIWLQRWHPTCSKDKSLEEQTNLQPNGAGPESVGCAVLSRIESRNFDRLSVCNNATDLKGVLKNVFAQDGIIKPKDEKEQGFGLQMQPAKVISNATGLDLVGTAARQISYAQPGRNSSLAFWSGFGMPAVWKVARKDVKNT